MEPAPVVEKIAPIAASPLDSSRGRGKKRAKVINGTPKVKTKSKRDSLESDSSFPKVVVLFMPESPHIVGYNHVK